VADQGSEGLLSPFLRSRRVEQAMPFLTGTVLDIGCGSGVLARHLPPKGYLGFDQDSAVLELARRSYPEHRFTSTMPKGQHFDTIVALALLEHLDDPGAALREWQQQLAPGGRIVATTPHPRGDRLHRTGARLGLFSQSAAEEHTALLDRRSLAALGGGASLRITHYRRFLLGMNQVVVLEREL
jgi:2-polyprenyl-3-methyl-5-hydroxy-6-metoxy-1,4-benzoquinol methylase